MCFAGVSFPANPTHGAPVTEEARGETAPLFFFAYRRCGGFCSVTVSATLRPGDAPTVSPAATTTVLCEPRQSSRKPMIIVINTETLLTQASHFRNLRWETRDVTQNERTPYDSKDAQKN